MRRRRLDHNFRELTRLEQKEKCENCIYYHSLGDNSYACRKMIHDTFALSSCLRNNFKYFTPFVAPDTFPINLFTDLFQAPLADTDSRLFVFNRTSDNYEEAVRHFVSEQFSDREEELLDSLLDDAIRDTD